MNTREEQLAAIKQLEESSKQGKSLSTLVSSAPDFSVDKRRCLTAVYRIPNEIAEDIIRKVEQPLKQVDSRQYYYPPESLHMTVQNIRISSFPANFTEGDIRKVSSVFQKVVPHHQPISFEFVGLLEPPTSLSLIAVADENLMPLLQDLRPALEEAGVPDDKVYVSPRVYFGNTTICRYTTEPNQDFFETVKKLKDVKVGTVTVDKIELVTTNPVFHPDLTESIEIFSLNK